MITIEQCRAARGLLDWTQQDLADRSGLSKTAINNFEKGYSDIKTDSLRAIRSAFENNDIEFIDKIGLKKKSEAAKILHGKTAFQDLLNDIERFLDDGDELLISHMDRKFSDNYGPGKLHELLQRCRKVRILGTRDALPDVGNNRVLPPETVQSGVMTFLYGRKTAMVLWGRSVIILIDSREACEAERQHFEHLWEQAGESAAQKRGKDHGKEMGRA